MKWGRGKYTWESAGLAVPEKMRSLVSCLLGIAFPKWLLEAKKLGNDCSLGLRSWMHGLPFSNLSGSTRLHLYNRRKHTVPVDRQTHIHKTKINLLAKWRTGQFEIWRTEKKKRGSAYDAVSEWEARLFGEETGRTMKRSGYCGG